MTTPKYPVFDDAFIDFYYFFCPNRILWDDFKQFMGEIDDKPWMPTKTYKVPQIKIETNVSRQYPKEGSILDYMGVPTKITPNGKTEVNALPVRAYVMVWNEYFRDQNVGNAAVLKTDSSDIKVEDRETESEDTLENELKWAIAGGRCLPVNKFHDYFTSCLPYPQRGPNVTVPMTGNAPLTMKASGIDQTDYGTLEFVLGKTTASNKPGGLVYTQNPVTKKTNSSTMVQQEQQMKSRVA